MIWMQISGFQQTNFLVDSFRETGNPNNAFNTTLLSTSGHSVIFDAVGINPSELIISGYGAHLFNSMELSQMPVDKNLECGIDFQILISLAIDGRIRNAGNSY